MILYILIWFLFGRNPPGFIIENDSLTDWCSMIIVFIWFHFNSKQTAGIVISDLQQLWPAHRNDALKNIGWYIARLRRVPAVWCSKYSHFYMTQIKHQTAGWINIFDMTMTILSEWRQKNSLLFQRRRRSFNLLRRLWKRRAFLLSFRKDNHILPKRHHLSYRKWGCNFDE